MEHRSNWLPVSKSDGCLCGHWPVIGRPQHGRPFLRYNIDCQVTAADARARHSESRPGQRYGTSRSAPAALCLRRVL
ncbi:MAG: hypothetical protein QOI83_3551 [Streptomycetaceae bacterium]|jgi:hypothetical protein|nr:hypothetical protein [Streptomycetaceae bacterium]